MKTDQEFLAEQISDRLVGGTIRNAMISEDGNYVGFSVVVKSKGRGNYDVIPVWVNCDPEGNGSGWLEFGDDT
jgi:hypothetical protein